MRGSISIECICRAKAAADAGVAVESAARVPASCRPATEIGLKGIVPEDCPAIAANAAAGAVCVLRLGVATATEKGAEPAAPGLLPLWMFDIVAVLP